MLSDPLRDGAMTVIRTLRAKGFEALFAGGCVRDMVLGKPPKDYDVATSAPPEAVLEAFAKAIPVGVQFGVVRVIIGGREYEVATFRSDGAYVDGRRPTGVSWASAEDDVARRDFTINGLLYDPIADTVLDHVGGRADLEARIIRAIGNPAARFAEDHLRVLRALRFAARLDFAIEAETWRQIQAFAPKVGTVSIERIRDELDRLLTEGGGARGLDLLVDSGVGQAILPGLDLVAPARHFRGLGPCDSAVGWGLLLCASRAPDPATFLEAMRHSRQFTRLVAELVAAVDALRAYPTLRVADRKRLLRQQSAGYALTVAAAMGIDTRPPRAELRLWSAAALAPAPLLTGRDLQAAGFAPGPRFRDALEAVETAQLEDVVHDAEAAMRLAREVLEAP